MDGSMNARSLKEFESNIAKSTILSPVSIYRTPTRPALGLVPLPEDIPPYRILSLCDIGQKRTRAPTAT